MRFVGSGGGYDPGPVVGFPVCAIVGATVFPSA
jgi:hypothetical protein